MKFKKSKKLFAHIDCDSFFASCEILANPSLKYKYVCVGSEIVVAATYNAKKKGITVGMPIWQARETLGNNAVFLGGNFELYGEVSHSLMDYLQKQTLSIEKFSIDEAFCEITGLPELYKKSLLEYLQDLQNDIYKKIGIPVSIGVSNTRIKAKIFSDLRKPYGIFVGGMFESEYETFEQIAFKKIPFAGQKTQKRFLYRCKTIDDFLKIGFWQLKNETGKSMTTLRLELQGVNAFQIDNTKAAKSVSRSRSFNKNKTSNKSFLMNQILGHFELLHSQITESSTQIKEISLMFRDAEFQIHKQNYHFNEHTNERRKILQEVKTLFSSLYNLQLLYRSTGITFSGLKTHLPKQLNLFEKETQKRDSSQELSRALNRINAKYGTKKIGFGGGAC